MADRGNDQALQELRRARHSKYPKLFTSHLNIKRHDPLLIEMVETLGKEANGDSATLTIYILEQEFYEIEEYDGWETVIEPHDIKWQNAKIK